MTGIDADLARWITAPGEDPQNPLLRTAFTLPAAPLRARLLVTGLGVFRARVNGAEALPTRLDPGLTDPRRRVLVCEADPTDLLRPGQNVLAIALGRGFHALTTPNVWRWEQAPWRGPVRAWAHLSIELADGTRRVIRTDDSWRTWPGPVTADSLYEGETFAPEPGADVEAWTRPGFDDSAWLPVLEPQPAAAPETLQLREAEGVVEVAEIRPQVVRRDGGRLILDMGRVIAGWCRYALRADVPAEAAPLALTARHGEKLRPDGTVDDDNEHIWTPRFQCDEVRLEPSGARSFAPQFSYKGFRYVQIDVLAGDLDMLETTGIHAHADLAVESSLRSSEPYLERFDAAMRASLANNLHHVPTDTPMHEKNGWTGDALVALESLSASFAAHRTLRAFLQQQADAQRPDGSLPVIAPTPGWGYTELSPAPEWTTLFPVLIDHLATEYGDADVVAQHSAAARAHLDHELARRDADGLIDGVLGDYLTPGSPGPAPEDRRLTGTLFVARALRRLAHALDLDRARRRPAAAADALSPDARRLREQAASLERAVNAAFLDAGAGEYRIGRDGGFRMTASALALTWDVVPAAAREAVVSRLVEEIGRRGDHHDCGHIGVRYLLGALSEAGHGDLAWRVLTNPTAPGWRAWLEAGNSTFMEMWEQPRSCSHYFMGTPQTWIHEHVAGLRRGADGWAEAVLAPDPAVPVDRVELVRRSVAGTFRVAVDRRERRLDASVPAGARVLLRLPGLEETLDAGEHARHW